MTAEHPLHCLMCARHGCELMGCKSHIREPKGIHMMNTINSTGRRHGCIRERWVRREPDGIRADQQAWWCSEGGLNAVSHRRPLFTLIPLVIDNHGSHTTKRVKEWRTEHHRFPMHVIPTLASWPREVLQRNHHKENQRGVCSGPH